jgi:hypothetical protein
MLNYTIVSGNWEIFPKLAYVVTHTWNMIHNMVRRFREPNPPSVANTICRLFLNCPNDSESSIVSCLLDTHEDPYKVSCCLDQKQSFMR